MSVLLARHLPESNVCFGPAGARDAAQLAAYAHAIAAALPAAGGQARVLLACSDRYHFSAALAAIWLRGYTAELPPNGQPATVHALAAADGVIALLHDRDEPQGLDVRSLEAPGQRAAVPLTLPLAPDRRAAIVYTSGSTGQPVAHEKALVQLLAEPEAHIAGFGLGGRRVVAAVPPYHIYGLLFGVLVPLLGGGSTSRGGALHPAELLREIQAGGADVLIAVPPHLAALAALDDAEAAAWPRLHRVFSSAAPLPAAISEQLAARGMVVTEVLGSTETGGIATRTSAGAPWDPLPSLRIRVDQDAGLWVDSPWLSPHAARPVQTADRVELVGENGFRHLGRSDAVVKIGGRRIDLGELEARLKQCAHVRDARVLAVDGGGVRGTSLLAVVESDQADVAELRRSLAEHVDPVAVPRRFRVVPRLPRSPTGKITRGDLLALFDTWSFPAEPLPDGRVRFAVPETLGFFRGHFDEQPILPGVAQLQHLALAEARRRFPELGALARATRVKFKRLIAPGETLTLSLSRKGEQVVQFALEADGHPAASGIFHFRAGGP